MLLTYRVNKRRSCQAGFAAEYVLNNIVAQLLNLLRRFPWVESGGGGDRRRLLVVHRSRIRRWLLWR